MKKDFLKNVLGVGLFYFVIIVGVLLLNSRFTYLNEVDDVRSTSYMAMNQ